MSKEAIVEKILSEARSQAENTIRTANERADALGRQAEDARRAEYEKKIASVKRDAALMVSGQETLLRLDERKSELAVKCELIDKVYFSAEERILRLSDKEYLGFIAGLIRKFAENGDKVIIAKVDERRLSKAWLSDLAFDLQLELSLSNEFHIDKGGIILSGERYDKNLTLSAIIKEIRARTENIIASKLFG